MVGDCGSSHNFSLEILNLKGLQNQITGSRVMASFQNWWILPISAASAVEGPRSTGLPCLVTRVAGR